LGNGHGASVDAWAREPTTAFDRNDAEAGAAAITYLKPALNMRGELAWCPQTSRGAG
jgi:hypothetical protein